MALRDSWNFGIRSPTGTSIAAQRRFGILRRKEVRVYSIADGGLKGELEDDGMQRKLLS